MKKLLEEFVGAFFIMFVAGNAVIAQHPLTALAIGATLTIATYMSAATSGAHFNPAVSLAAWRRGSLSFGELPKYVGVQFVGALLGAWLAEVVQGAAVQTYVIAQSDMVALSRTHLPGDVSIILAEFIGTFMLAYAVLKVTTSRETLGNSYYGLVIGGAMAIGIVAVSNITGGLFNPALSAGLVLIGAKKWPLMVEYWFAQMLAGWLAAEYFRYLNAPPKEKRVEVAAPPTPPLDKGL